MTAKPRTVRNRIPTADQIARDVIANASEFSCEYDVDGAGLVDCFTVYWQRGSRAISLVVTRDGKVSRVVSPYRAGAPVTQFEIGRMSAIERLEK